MKQATVHSVCECQAKLTAELNEERLVRRGWATDRKRGKTEAAPAHAIGAERTQFQVAWFCPFCIRNVLRSFDSAALSFRDVPDDAPAASLERRSA